MSVSLWAYEPVTCDNENCCGDCDYCNHLPAHEADFYEEEGRRMIDYKSLIKRLKQDGFHLALVNRDIAFDCYMAADAIEELLKNQKEKVDE